MANDDNDYQTAWRVLLTTIGTTPQDLAQGHLAGVLNAYEFIAHWDRRMPTVDDVLTLLVIQADPRAMLRKFVARLEVREAGEHPPPDPELEQHLRDLLRWLDAQGT